MRRFLSATWRLLRRPLWVGPADIPRGTAVDPTLFPEDEYPVECMRCGYDLHGLPDGRCPECGESFERGVLLVQKYARGLRPRTDARLRLAWVLMMGGIAIGLLCIGGHGILVQRYPASLLSHGQLYSVALGLLIISVFLISAGCAVFLVFLLAVPLGGKKGRAVRAATLSRICDVDSGRQTAEGARPKNP